MTTGIHLAIMNHIKATLQKALIDDWEPEEDEDVDPAQAGVVKLGPLQGDPEPDDARISVTIYENDPDNFDTNEEWGDSVYDIECGGAITFSRKFTVKVRCLYETTQEGLDSALEIASTVKERLEVALLTDKFTNVVSGNERVSRGILAQLLQINMRQSGGPPDAYDFHIRARFDVLTTRTGV